MALPPSSKYLQRAADPVDERERESLTARLNGAFADGRITHEQYAEAMDVVYAAHSLGDLVPVIERLPAAVAEVPAIVARGGSTPAGRVSESRNLLPLAVGVGVVGVALVSILVLLLMVAFL
ncbi:DUF1707 SHOCT-like domain-containing protein [Tessaracoccus sp. Z1128]